MSVNVNTTTNAIVVQNANQTITVVDNENANIVNVTQPLVNVIEVVSPGPQGPVGPAGPQGSSGLLTTLVGNCNSFSIPNNILFYGAYLGGTPVNPAVIDTRTGSFATSFFPGYPMPAGTASNLTIVLRTAQPSNTTSFAYIANANSAITGSVITIAAGTAAGIYSSSINPVLYNQSDRLTVILSNPFAAGASPSGNITTFSFTYKNA